MDDEYPSENSSEHSKSDSLLDENCSYNEFIFNILSMHNIKMKMSKR